jgi:phage gpG-like protein
MIQMAIVGDPNRVPQYLLDRIPKAIVGIEKAMARIVLKLQVKIQTEKLSGQVLNQRHGGGGLKQSIHSDVQTGGYSVIGRGFTNKEYAAIHEFGFDGEETVRAHTLCFKKRQVFKEELGSS